MKRKPNKPRPEPWAQTGRTDPGGGAADPGGSAFGAGSEKQSGPGEAGTSGQSVPKSPKSKFRQKSQQEQAAASKLRMEKQGRKVEKAKEKLARQKPPKKPGPVKRAGRVASGSVHGFVHGKIFEVEQENVGTEGAHRSELVGESVLRHGSRFVKRKIREHPARAVQKAEARYVKRTADYHFHTAAQEHPELSKNFFARYWQKQRNRKQYQKRAKEAAKQGAKAAGKTAAATEKLAVKAAGFVKRHPAGSVIALACILLVFLVQSCSSSLVTIGNAGAGALGATTYPSEDGDMLGAEAAYTGLEAELKNYLDTYESTHDYDEYHFDLDEIEHDPYVLISILSALHEGQWTLSQAAGTLQMLFDRQYILTEEVVVEVRYRTETRTDSEGNDYEVEIPYNYYICYVTLENKNLSHLPVYFMSEEQMSRYAIYMSTVGNRPDLFPDSPYVDRYITNPPQGYEVPGEYLDDETFAAMLSEAQKYIGYPYVWGGSSPATSFDCSGYLSWVINHSGWNVGRQTAQGLYNLCTPVSSPRPGDLVFFKGTYNTSGVSHCGIYVGDGRMLHCGDPIGYANLNTSYWQSHLYAYGRLP
ncbi:C40 family peptidase [uncultured Oscillibacter sp.]|uniref:C40 family peptidase n=1 Tax=uncultured Oscillibacter sp. TaxID=876091 RepID=UPI00272AF412|nr:C40 family peptidase [uncultured Oscillibacter sp.]